MYNSCYISINRINWIIVYLYYAVAPTIPPTREQCSTNAPLSGVITQLKIKKGRNSKTIALQSQAPCAATAFVMMSRYSKFGVDTLNTFLNNGLH